MDPITLMLLTVTLNALVTGVIVYLFQKRIERTFAKENFEYQTKFADIYSKRIKASETIIHKYMAFENSMWLLTDSIRDYINSGVENEINFEEGNKDIMSKLAELREFYKNNRMFLSKYLSNSMNGALVYASLAQYAVSSVSKDPMIESVPSEWIELFPELPVIPEFEDEDLNKPEWFLYVVSIKLKNISEFLERVYRSEAELE